MIEFVQDCDHDLIQFVIEKLPTQLEWFWCWYSDLKDNAKRKKFLYGYDFW